VKNSNLRFWVKNEGENAQKHSKTRAKALRNDDKRGQSETKRCEVSKKLGQSEQKLMKE